MATARQALAQRRTGRPEFPINRRHQGLATCSAGSSCESRRDGFQSIGVTKDWRLDPKEINGENGFALFPINRRHQGLATAPHRNYATETATGFQSIGVTKDWRHETKHIQVTTPPEFPINRRHQGLATGLLGIMGILELRVSNQ